MNTMSLLCPVDWVKHREAHVESVYSGTLTATNRQSILASIFCSVQKMEPLWNVEYIVKKHNRAIWSNLYTHLIYIWRLQRSVLSLSPLSPCVQTEDSVSHHGYLLCSYPSNTVFVIPRSGLVRSSSGWKPSNLILGLGSGLEQLQSFSKVCCSFSYCQIRNYITSANSNKLVWSDYYEQTI